MAWRCGVPGFFDRNALHNHSDASKKSDDSCDCKASPDNPNLDFASYDPEEKDTDGTLSHPDDHDTSNLAEELILDRCEVYDRISHFGEQSPQTVDGPHGDEDSVSYMEDLNLLVQIETAKGEIFLPMQQRPNSRQARWRSE